MKERGKDATVYHNTMRTTLDEGETPGNESANLGTVSGLRSDTPFNYKQQISKPRLQKLYSAERKNFLEHSHVIDFLGSISYFQGKKPSEFYLKVRKKKARSK